MATPLAELIVELREEQSQSQNEFAHLLGLSKSTLSRVLAGERPSDIVVVRLLERFPGRATDIAAALAGQPLPEREPEPVAV